MKCLSCGTPHPPDAKVCLACGTPVPPSALGPLRSELVPAPPSALVPAEPAALVPAEPAALVPAGPAPPGPAPEEKLQFSGPSTAVSQRMSQRNLPAAEDPRTLMPIAAANKLAGRYQLKQKIGEGGMGTVYTAHDSELDREVAIKMLSPNLVNDAEVVERFEREARLTASLDHPNIVPIYDVGRHEGRPFIVMKLLQGDTLAGVLRHKGGFTSDDTLKLMKQLAAGLDYIHQRGFIHRDIKAGNIFLSPEGHATILDFGILRSRKANASLTRTGMVMGTPHYMAPEQAMGMKDVDHRVDLYALAVVLFECLTGTLPFEADSELRLIQMQAHSPPPEILDRAPWIPKTVADVVKKALSKKADDRYYSGLDLVKALERAYRDSGGHPAAPKHPPPSVGVITGSGLKVLPSLSPGTSAPRLPVVSSPSPAPQPGPVAEPAPPQALMTGELASVRPGRLPFVVLALVSLVAVGVALWRPWETRVVNGPDSAVDAGAPALVVSLGDAGSEGDDAGPALVAEVDAGLDELVDAGALADVPADGGRVVVGLTKRRGKLNVITMHAGEPYWAQVSIDGVPRGRTPLLLDLPAGRYQVRVERPGFRVEERRVLIAAGKPALVKIDLSP
ncbi:MAG: protein kinase [Myxococcaceae bacterium]|nr:protein kinase [Myxococcaceae bacterium]